MEKLIACALKLLSKRPQSEKEVKDKLGRFLRRRKIEDKKLYLAETLKYLKKLKVLNDADFARWFMEQRAQFRPRSKRGLYFELKQKGLSQEIIQQTLADYDEEAACQKLAQKKSSLSPKALASYLLRQGFPSDLVKQTVNLNQVGRYFSLNLLSLVTLANLNNK